MALSIPLVPCSQMVEIAESRFGDATGSGTDDEVKTEKQFIIRAGQTKFTIYCHSFRFLCVGG